MTKQLLCVHNTPIHVKNELLPEQKLFLFFSTSIVECTNVFSPLKMHVFYYLRMWLFTEDVVHYSTFVMLLLIICIFTSSSNHVSVSVQSKYEINYNGEQMKIQKYFTSLSLKERRDD
jgi:hypothetical protein